MSSKLIILPLERYQNLVKKAESALGPENESPENEMVKETKVSKDLKKATAATLKGQEVQEILQRKREYQEAEEEIPKTLDKPIRQKATTLVPPPGIKQKDNLFGKSKKKKVVKKPAKTNLAPNKNVGNGLGRWKFISD